MFKPLLQNIHHKLVNNAPNILAFPITFLPFIVQKKLLGDLLAVLFKEAIEDGDLAFLEDKWLKVEVVDVNLIWFLSFYEDQLIIKASSDQVDVSFSGNLNELILIAGRKEDPDTLFFQRRLTIQGDVDLGLEVKNLLDNIDFDSLPKIAKQSIQHFSSFVQQGIKAPANKVMV
ncbi:MAG: SCP2 sterol-binding domain-containing protein [Psychromonas sp.]